MRTVVSRWRIAITLPAAPGASRRAEAGPSRRRSATAIMIGLVVFAAARFGFGWAIDTERSPLRDPIYFDKLAILRQHDSFLGPASSSGPTRVLFIGSSRALNAIDARAASQQLSDLLGRPVEAFNFGQAGAGPVTNAVYVRRLMKAGVNADFVLIEVHPVFLAGQR